MKSLLLVLALTCAVWTGQSAEESSAEKPVEPDKELAQRLIAAVDDGDLDDVRAALKDGAQINSHHGTKGITALMLAAKQGHTEIVDLLLAQGADVNAESNEGATPLYFAFGSKHRDIAIRLLDKGAKIGINELTLSIQLEDPKLTRGLLAKKKFDLNEPCDLLEGVTALNFAILRKQPEIARMFLQAGADPDLAMKPSEQTPLMSASRANQLELAEELLKAKVQVNAKNEAGQTALMLAAAKGRASIVRLLLENGADLGQRDNEGSTPLMFAAREGLTNEVRQMLRLGAEANPSKPNSALELLGGDYAAPVSKITALMLASNRHHPGVVTLLLDAGADVNASDQDGNTALMWAVMLMGDAPEAELDPEVVRRLIKAGADIKVRNNDGETPRHRLRKQFEGWRSMSDPGWADKPLSDSFKEVDDLLLKAGAP